MIAVCLLTLALGAAPPCPRSIDVGGFDGGYAPASPNLPLPLGSTRPEDGGPFTSPTFRMYHQGEQPQAKPSEWPTDESDRWLSQNERLWLEDKAHSPEFREECIFTMGDKRAVEWGVSYSCQNNGSLGYVIAAIPYCAALVADPQFRTVMRESLRIRTSDLSPAEKGRKLAKFVQPWMQPAQVHAIFGDTANTLYIYSESGMRCGGIVYTGYRVVVDFHTKGEGPTASSLSGSESAGLTLTEIHEQLSWHPAEPQFWNEGFRSGIQFLF